MEFNFGNLGAVLLEDYQESRRATTDQLRYNEGKPRMNYVLAAPTAHIAMRLLGFDTYKSEHYEMLLAACMFQRGLDGGEEFVRNVCELVEKLTGKCGAELYQHVAEFGEKKYSRGNFLLGANISQYLDSWLRHFKAFVEGAEMDADSGKPHLAHLVWNTVEASRWENHETRDDRLKENAK